MKGRGLKIFALLAIVVMVFGVTGAALAAPPAVPEVCPEGDGWSDHQDPPLSSVEGADEYCVKGGSSSSQGCTGYLVIGSFSEVQAAVNAVGACGLSHWGYHTPEQQPTSTPTPEDPTATPTPTDTPTEGPSPTPTVTNTPGDPTSTPPPPPREEPKTGPGDALPVAGVATFLSLLGIAGASLRFALKRI